MNCATSKAAVSERIKKKQNTCFVVHPESNCWSIKEGLIFAEFK